MSKKSSRSVASKQCVPIDFPLPESHGSPSITNSVTDLSDDTSRKHYTLRSDFFTNEKFSEFIAEDEVFNFCLSNCDGSSESHSQSSWSDDLEYQSTKAIKTEFELVERLLYGEEEFSVFNEEFDQWTKNFQHLRILGGGIKHPIRNLLQKPESIEEVLAEHRDAQFEIVEDNSIADLKTKVKKAVIAKVIENIESNKSLKKKVNKTSPKPVFNKSNPKIKILDRKSKTEKSFLPIRIDPLHGVAPVTLHHAYPNQTSIMRSHNLSSKWQKSDSIIDFTSLPTINPSKINQIVKKVDFGVVKKHNIGNFSSNSAERRPKSSKKLPGSQGRNITLPPIQNFKNLHITPDEYHENFFHRSSSCNNNCNSSETSSAISKTSMKSGPASFLTYT